MARAGRHFIPGQIWHLTHRCQRREFLLKFARDRQQWLHWIEQALKGKARGRKMRKTMDGWELREVEMLYKADFGGQNGVMEPKNLHFWRPNDTISVT